MRRNKLEADNSLKEKDTFCAKNISKSSLTQTDRGKSHVEDWNISENILSSPSVSSSTTE